MDSNIKEKDKAAKDFFSMDRNYASLCNGKLHDGRPVIKPENLRDADSSVRLKHMSEKNRDVVKRIEMRKGGSVTYRVVNIEAQSYEDRMMVLRNLTYEVGEYDRQMRRIKHRNRDNNEGVKYPSYLRDDDILEPVVTIMVNLSGAPWKSPRRLSELFAIDDPEFLNYVNDYEMVIVDPYYMTQEELDKFTGEVKTIFSLLAFKDDMAAHSQYIMSLKEDEDVISEEAWRMLENYAGFKETDRNAALNREGKMVVSKAIEQRVQMAVEAAILETRKEDQKRMQEEQKRMLRQYLEGYITMIKSNTLSRESAALLLKMTPEEFDRTVQEAGLSI